MTEITSLTLTELIKNIKEKKLSSFEITKAFVERSEKSKKLNAYITEDFSSLNSDIGFLGIPYDAGNSWRPGTRFGPREIRSYSSRYSSWGGNVPEGYWDINQDKRYLEGIIDWEKIISKNLKAVIGDGQSFPFNVFTK